MSNDFYVYEWYNTYTNEVFYVGKGRKHRWKTLSGRNQYFLNYHNKYNCDVRKIKDKMTEKDAFDLEIEMIRFYKNKQQCQCNLSEGGEGCTLDKNSWEYMYRKVRNLNNFKNIRLDEMPFADFFNNEDLKELSLEELHEMYNLYLFLKEKMAVDDINFEKLEDDEDECFTNYLKYSGIIEKDIDDYVKPYNKMNTKDLLDACDFIHIQTLSLISEVIKDDRLYDNSVSNFEKHKIISTLFNNFEYCCHFTHAITSAMWLLKNNSFDEEELLYCTIDAPSDLIIKTFSIIDEQTLRIRLKTSKKSNVKTIHINLYDLILDMLGDTLSNIYELIYLRIKESIEV